MPDLVASLGKSFQEGEFSQLFSQHGKENGRYSVEGPVSAPFLVECLCNFLGEPHSVIWLLSTLKRSSNS